MEKKLDKEITMSSVEEWVNEYMEEDVLDAGRTDYLERWNYFSLLGLESDQTIETFLQVVAYINELSLTEESKIKKVLTLAYLITEEKWNIEEMDINSVYLLLSYLDSLERKKMKASLARLNQPDLLFAIRLKSLDLDIRFLILQYIDQNKKKEKDMIRFLRETDYYDLVKLVS